MEVSSAPPSRSATSDWLWPHLKWITVPVWLLSIVSHLLLALLILTLSQLPSCRGDFSKGTGDDFRSAGIRTRSERPVHHPSEQQSPDEATAQPTVPAVAATAVTIPDQPPIPLTLPMPIQAAASPPVLGAGLPAAFDASQFSSIVKPSTQAAPATGGGAAAGEPAGTTSFLGISDSGRSFVYVIDRSSSMEEDGRFRAARNELFASLEQLNETQRFQVIFYNAKFIELKPKQDRFDMFFGTPEQRLQVVRQVNEIRPEGGTLHFPAIMRAVQLKPDVIFLLTDGDPQSALTARELEEIRTKNNGRAHIHCIEFGKGPVSPNGKNAAAGNYLDKLAQQNGGRFIYRNVVELNRY
jgi:hypothetical protein